MNSKWVWMIGVIVLTNFFTFVIVKNYFPTTNNYYLLKMKGQGEYWKITDYQFAWVPDRGAEQGNEVVTYLADPNELTGEIVVEIYDYFNDGVVPHLTHTRLAENLENDSFKAGGGGGYPDNDLTVKDIINKTHFLIRWTTKDGKQHEEQILMELDYNLPILSQIE